MVSDSPTPRRSIDRMLEMSRDANAAYADDGVELYEAVDGVRTSGPATYQPNGRSDQIPDRIQVTKDTTKANVSHELSHHTYGESAVGKRDKEVITRIGTRLEKGESFQDLTLQEKLSYHRAISRSEQSAAELDLAKAQTALSKATDPDEIRRLEGQAADAIHHRDAMDAQLAELGDESKVPKWLHSKSDLNAPRREAFTDRFPDEASRQEAVSSFERMLDDPTVSISADDLGQLGYGIDRNGTAYRPSGTLGELPAVRKVAGKGYIRSARAGKAIDFGANATEGVDMVSPLDAAAGFTSELKHGKRFERATRDGDKILKAESIGDLVKIRDNALGVKGLEPAQRARMEELSEKLILTSSEETELGKLTAQHNQRKEAMRRARAASEVLGEEAAHQAMKNRPNSRMKLLHAGQGQGTFDQIWVDELTGDLFFVEAKGGSAANRSCRKIEDSLKIAQQGSGRYFEDLWVKGNLVEVLRRRAAMLGDPAATKKMLETIKKIDMAVEKNLRRPIAERQNIVPSDANYIMLQQKLSDQLGVLREKGFK